MDAKNNQLLNKPWRRIKIGVYSFFENSKTDDLKHVKKSRLIKKAKNLYVKCPQCQSNIEKIDSVLLDVFDQDFHVWASARSVAFGAKFLNRTYKGVVYKPRNPGYEEKLADSLLYALHLLKILNKIEFRNRKMSDAQNMLYQFHFYYSCDGNFGNAFFIAVKCAANDAGVCDIRKINTAVDCARSVKKWKFKNK